MALRASTAGMTIVELLVTVLLMAFAMVAIGELVVLNTVASTKLTNSIDGQVGCARAIRRICEDVRSAKSIGTGSGPQILILVQPTFFNSPNDNLDGFPLQSNSGGNLTSCVDTVTYQIISDSVNLGTYDLLVTRVSGIPTVNSNGRPSISAQTVLTGIVGPNDPRSSVATGPTPFQYLPYSYGPSPNWNPATTLLYPPSDINLISIPPIGVSINFEVQTPPSGVGANIRRTGAHVESYLRCNTDALYTN